MQPRATSPWVGVLPWPLKSVPTRSSLIRHEDLPSWAWHVFLSRPLLYPAPDPLSSDVGTGFDRLACLRNCVSCGTRAGALALVAKTVTRTSNRPGTGIPRAGSCHKSTFSPTHGVSMTLHTQAKSRSAGQLEVGLVNSSIYALMQPRLQ
ncbi:hypothetical protein GY45DRAFT_1320452 [Cubamyces sp. BRFM 1775]|nr:hypothetical protein GY45DRAFT_1320452 [Cubamyces sp. BRFM 1775]